MAKVLLLIAMLGSPEYKQREKASKALEGRYDQCFLTRVSCHLSELKTNDEEVRKRLASIRRKRYLETVPPLPYLLSMAYFVDSMDESGPHKRIQYCWPFPNEELCGDETDQWAFDATRTLYRRLLWYGMNPIWLREYNSWMYQKFDFAINQEVDWSNLYGGSP